MANKEREALWAGRVAQWRNSGLSQRAFGLQQGYPQRQLSEIIGQFRKSRRRNTRWPTQRYGKLKIDAVEDRLCNGAYCPQVSVVRGDVIDIGELAWQDIVVGPISRLRE